MKRRTFRATSSLAIMFACTLGSLPASAADLIWEVESPFRFFKRSSTFEVQEKAFLAVRGQTGSPLPANIVWRTERKLNDPDCQDSSSPQACAATARGRYEASRQGWASQTVDFTCYDRNARPRRYGATCERQYSWGTAKEDYILPDAHTVQIRLSPEQLATAGTGQCTWSWQPRRGGAGETKAQACKDKLVIKRTPFSLDRRVSGVSVKVTLPDGAELTDPNVIVEDVFLVALGDSFASGDGNPDKPVVLSGMREMVYDPALLRDDVASAKSLAKPNFNVASAGDAFNPKALPKRLLEDEQKGLMLKANSNDFQAAFDKRSAQWLSPDCHRSQYGYPFRTGIELTLENRHRAVTFVSLACSGAETVEGLFGPREARERFNEQKMVASQFDQLSELICRGPRSRSVSYTLPIYSAGSTAIGSQTFTKNWCPPESRKRPIDLTLLSIGGNDVGFSALAMYAMTDSADAIAPIVGLIGRQVRFAPNVSRAYLSVLDQRMKAVKDALVDGFGVEPSRVLQNAYEPLQFDETGQVCGAQPTVGVDVHPDFRYNKDRTQDVSNFVRELQGRMECMADGRKGSCPSGMATGAGTGFRFVTDHVAEFNKRGLCARDPQRAFQDQINMTMPRMSRATDDWKPYSPAAAIPYARHWRLARNPNDVFLSVNLHREGTPLIDIIQPAYASLYSGAFHPTAEGHSIVADHVVRHARDLLDKRMMVAN